MSDFKEVVGLGIRLIRKAKGMSQEVLADGAGVSPSYMGEVERGRRNISLDTLERISKALGVAPIDIMRTCSFETEAKKQGKSLALEKHIAFMSTRNTQEIDLIHKIAKDVLIYVEDRS